MTHHQTMSIIGGGWSFANVDPAKLPGHVISVNEAAVLLDPQTIHYGVSMDRLWCEHRYSLLKQRKVLMFGRRAAVKNLMDWEDQGFVIFDNDHTSIRFSESMGTLNGTNSGMCALNLAYKMRPKLLYLFGFDHCRSPAGKAYWHEPYPWADPMGATKPGKYAEWSRQYDAAAALFKGYGCQVFNVSPQSSIQVFDKIAPHVIGVER